MSRRDDRLGAPTLERPDRRRGRRRRTDRGVDASRVRKAAIALAVVALVAVVGLVGFRLFGGRSQPVGEQQEAVVTDIPDPTPIVRVQGTSLELVPPAQPPELIGVGLHQAENPRAKDLVPLTPLAATADPTATVKHVEKAWGKDVVLFQMNSRGRGTAKRSAMDCAVRDGTQVVSPVSGKVTLIKSYRLYGRYDDLHVEIEPEDHPELRVVGIHLKDLTIHEGDEVEAGRTVVGKPRTFGFDPQIDRFLGRKAEHVHFQVNPYPPVR